jgi:iron complex outermembrane receptor protein
MGMTKNARRYSGAALSALLVQTVICSYPATSRAQGTTETAAKKHRAAGSTAAKPTAKPTSSTAAKPTGTAAATAAAPTATATASPPAAPPAPAAAAAPPPAAAHPAPVAPVVAQAGPVPPPAPAPPMPPPAAAPVPPPPPPPAPTGAAMPPPAPPVEMMPPPDPAAAVPNAGLTVGAGEVPYFNPDEMDVVKVTVDRREKRLQDYAGSAAAFTEEDLERVGIKSVRDMASADPSLEIGTQEGNTEIFIRGVGSTNNTELGDPSAATHIDGIYIPRPRGVGSMFFDLERVELNRGPQGTVRGRNATAGSLNIITAKPKLSLWGAEGSLQYGNYSQKLTRAMVNVPIGDKVAVRIATFSENHDPFYKNAGPIRTITATESADSLATRVGVKLMPIQQLTFNVGADYTQEKGTGYSGSNYNGALLAGLQPNEIPDPRAIVYRGPQPSQDMQHWGLRLDANADLGLVQAQYLFGYRDLLYRQVSAGNLGVAYPGQVINPGDLDNWSTSYWRTASQSQVHELRLFTADTARLRATVGGFYFRERQQVMLLNTADQSNTFAGVEFNMPNVKGDSQAGYLDATFDITKIIRATGGVRYTHETKSRTGLGAVWNIDGVNPGGANFRYGTEGFDPAAFNRTLFPTGPVTPEQANAVFLDGVSKFGIRDTLGQALANGGQVRPGSILPQNGAYKDNFLDWRLGGEVDVAPNHLVYLNVTTGHTSGGFNDNVNITLPNGTTDTVAPNYKPERLYAGEVGSKNEFRDHTVRLNFAGFYYLYRDQVFQIVQQVASIADPTQVGPATALRFNAGKSHIMGLEVNGAWQLGHGFTVSGAGLFMDAKFDDGTEPVFDNRVSFGPGSTLAPSDRVKIAGNNLPRSPHVTVNYSLSQNIRTDLGWFDWIVGAQTRSSYFMTVFNGQGVDTQGNPAPQLNDVVPTYTRFDVGAGYTRPDGKMRISVFGNNVTNIAYMTTFINQPGLNLRFFNSPRQVGARLNIYW